MPATKNILLTTALLSSVALSGCASKLIGERIGAELVELKSVTDVGNCQTLGKTNVSVLAEVGFITRRPEDVEANLVQMARNSAVDRNGDTIVKGNSNEYGSRTFEIFRCKP